MLSQWNEQKFGSVLIGGTRNGVYKPKEFHGHGDKIVNMGELFGHPRLFAVPMKRVELSENEQKNSRLQKGDLLFARRSLVAEGAGKCSIVCDVIEPTTFESSIIRARPNPNLADSLYLYYFFSSPLGTHKLSTIRRQMAVSGVTGTDLVELSIPIPPLSEQRTIAAIFGALDDKIDLNKRMNDTLEGIAQALFKSWFVDFDPVKAKAEGCKPEGMDDATAALFPSSFAESSLGLIPEGWKPSSIGECFKLIMGQSPPGETYNEVGEGIAFYQGRTDFGFRFPIERVYCNAPTRFAERNDTLVSVRAPVGDVNMALDRCCIGRGVAALRHNSGAASFTYYTAQQLQAHFKNFDSEGTVFGSINKADFAKLPHIEPKDKVIQLYEAIAGALDKRIKTNEDQIRTLAEIRDNLLPRLISGKLRVDEISETVEAFAL